MAEYKTPGVYIDEVSKLPPSIASVETAIPAFIGYTQKADLKEPEDLRFVPKKINSMVEYLQFFGEPKKETAITVNIDTNRNTIVAKAPKPSKYLMKYSLEMFFANGGGACYIVSVGGYNDGEVISFAELKKGLDETDKINEITLLVFPDSMGIDSSTDYYTLHKEAIDKCVALQDRFVVMDVWKSNDIAQNDITILRNSSLGDKTEKLKYAAAYYPQIYVGIDYEFDETKTQVTTNGANAAPLANIKSTDNALYYRAQNAIRSLEMLLPVSSAIVGVYADVDRTRGVWKAPANVNIDYAIRPEILLTDVQQATLNVDAESGKSVNVIRSFPGRGPAMIWGARTLAGNDNEWRYINVRRYYNMVEESTKNATQRFVFESNDLNTWTLVKSMISNYLETQWKQGALQGATPREAFFVHIGLKETMTYQDVLEGRMIVEIGLAVVRPAEFIILKFMHKMLDES